MCVCWVCTQAQRVKAQRDMEEVQGVTFHPEISRHAQTIWGPHEVGSVPVWQRLSKGTDRQGAGPSTVEWCGCRLGRPPTDASTQSRVLCVCPDASSTFSCSSQNSLFTHVFARLPLPVPAQ